MLYVVRKVFWNTIYVFLTEELLFVEGALVTRFLPPNEVCLYDRQYAIDLKPFRHYVNKNAFSRILKFVVVKFFLITHIARANIYRNIWGARVIYLCGIIIAQ